MNQIISVLITGVGGGGLGEQLIKTLKISQANYFIIGCDISPYSKGLMEVDVSYVIPPANNENYISTLLKICKKHDVKVILPGSEIELSVISKSRNTFTNQGIFLPINPQKVIDICFDKFATIKFLSENGFNYPKTISVNSIENIKEIDFFPVIIKPSINSGGSKNTFIVQSKNELIPICKQLLNTNYNFVIQEYIGTPESEYTVGVLISMEGELINSIALKRNILSGLGNSIKILNKTKRKELGKHLVVSSGISQGVIGKFPEVTKECEKIALKLGCRSSVNLQCRLFNNEVYIFEINPRYSGTTPMRAMVGYNEPDILIKKHLFNKNIKPNFNFKSCTIVRGLQEIVIDEEKISKV